MLFFAPWNVENVITLKNNKHFVSGCLPDRAYNPADRNSLLLYGLQICNQHKKYNKITYFTSEQIDQPRGLVVGISDY